MTPKEKAVDLIEKFTPPTKFFDLNKGWVESKIEAQNAALIAVNEILSSFDGFMDARRNFRHELEIDAERYWLSVKSELEAVTV